jgi:hypothetical protein
MGATNEQKIAARALVKQAAETAALAERAIVAAEMERTEIERAIEESDRRIQPYRETLSRARAVVARHAF